MSNSSPFSPPLYRTAWRRMRQRPLQYVLFIVGIAIGVAMMVAIDLANGSASRAFALSADAVTGKTTHRIIGGPTGVDEAVYRRLRVELGYRLSAPVVEASVTSPLLGEQPYTLVGIDPLAEPPFRNYLGGDNGSGEGAAAFMVQRNGVVLSAEIAQTYDLALGDTIPLTFAGNQHDMVLIGIVEPQDELTQRGLRGLLLTDIASAQEIVGQIGRLSRIDLIAENERDLDPIRAILPPDVQLETAAARGNAIQQMTAAFELNLTALSLLALIVGMFLIYNTVTFSVVQRRPIFGILRCLGVTGQQLAGLILGEAVMLGLVGSLLGVGLGVLLGRGMVRLVTQTINDLYFAVTVREVTIPLVSLVKGVVIGIGAAILASLPPAYEAMHTVPTATLRRSTLESKVTKLLPHLVAGWLLLGGLGMLLLWLGESLVVSFAGLFAVLFAFGLITPPVTVLLMGWITPLLDRLLGTIGRMAARDIVRSLSRTSVAIAALMTAVSVIIGVSIMVGSFRRTVVDWLGQTLQADIYISPISVANSAIDGQLAPEIVAQIEQFDGIEQILTVRDVDLFAPALGRTVNAVAVNGDVSGGNRPILWQSAETEAIWQALLAGEGIIISEPLLRRENISIPPPPLTLLTAEGEHEFPVLAVLYDYTSDQGLIWVGSEPYRELWQDEAISSIAVVVGEAAAVDTLVTQMQTAFTRLQAVTVRSNQALRSASLEVFDRTFAITAALRLLATVVAFIGVLSTLMSLQLERARELGTLRATGMTQRQLWLLTLLETGLMGSVAGLVAMPTGYALAWILIYVINLRSFGWTLQLYLQPSYFLNAFFVAVTAALLAGIYPSIRLGRMVIASALRAE